MSIIKDITKSAVFLACGLVMYGYMKNNTPSGEQHQKAMVESVERIVTQIYEEKIEFPEESRKLADYLSKNVIPQAVEKILHGKIDLSDYHVFNIGTVTDDDGKEHVISIGFFDTVFTLNDDYVEEQVRSMSSSDEKENTVTNKSRDKE